MFTDLATIKKLPGNAAIGHNRYSTTGETSLKYTAFFADLYHGGLSIAHNGNLTNAITLRNDLVKMDLYLEQLVIQKQLYS